MGAGVVVGAGVVTVFFRRVDAVDGTGRDQPAQAIALAQWAANGATMLRVMKMLAVVKPGVLMVLQSGVAAAFDMPLSPWHPAWR